MAACQIVERLGTDNSTFYGSKGPRYCDPKQGQLENCSFVAALSAYVWTKQAVIKNAKSTWDASNFSYDIILHPEVSRNQSLEVTNDICLQSAGGIPKGVSSKNAPRNEIWPCIYEKAFSSMMPFDHDSNARWHGFNGAQCLRALSGKQDTTHATSDCSNGSQLYQLLKGKCVNRYGKMVYPSVAWTNPDSSGLCHTLTILGVTLNPVDYIILRDPTAPGSIVTADPQGGRIWKPAGIALGTDGVFAIKADDFKTKYVEFAFVNDPGSFEIQ